VIGLSAARALAHDGFAVTVYERHRVGTPLGSSPGRSRIYRRAYPEPDYVDLSAQAIELWRQIAPQALRGNGLMIHGAGVEQWGEAMESAGIAPEWIELDQARALFPEARVEGPVLWDDEGGAVMADEALVALAAGLDVREGVAVDDPRTLEADVVVACPGAWLGPMFDLPLEPWLEQVSYFAGAPDTRPSVIDLGRSERLFYALVAPGVGYKVAEDGVARPWDPDRPDRPVDPAQEQRIADYVGEWFPGLDPQSMHAEACLYTMTPDSDFVLDEIDGVVVCGGDSGHAFKLAPLLGRLAADLAQGRELPSQARRFAAGRLARS